MPNYPKSGIPLHMQHPEEHREKMQKGIVQLPQMPRSSGNDVLRRYPNGTLDVEYVALAVIEVIEKMKSADLGGHSGFQMTELEKAILSLIVPELGKLKMSPRMAALITHISPDEKSLVQHRVAALMQEKRNWNAGRGGGTVPGRSMTIDKSMSALQEYLEKASPGNWGPMRGKDDPERRGQAEEKPVQFPGEPSDAFKKLLSQNQTVGFHPNDLTHSRAEHLKAAQHYDDKLQQHQAFKPSGGPGMTPWQHKARALFTLSMLHSKTAEGA